MRSLKLLLIFICIAVFVGVLAFTTDYFKGVSLWYVYSLMGICMVLFYGVFPYFRKS
ncbi:hypothetical protein [Streptococcus macacae]|uniref:Uncharacterized protein n=1 Tax=Streptococcus macacae NCTC 11558 TaxID=764298 RepID=G5JWL0_9STRE|nr:hypothetical protein [Streptococcus macacae]EHJ52416.1 hypothetical protein STRMA_0982 [Streptococcus macacae NCTC 11558]SUN78794.1 Uncharacterised protein [Streptococcus macacae NCTC 11558]